jgi:hypothetical protein
MSNQDRTPFHLPLFNRFVLLKLRAKNVNRISDTLLCQYGSNELSKCIKEFLRNKVFMNKFTGFLQPWWNWQTRQT